MEARAKEVGFQFPMDASDGSLQKRQIGLSLGCGYLWQCICFLVLMAFSCCYHLPAVVADATVPFATSKPPLAETGACSRGQSRVAKSIITEHLLPAVERERGYTFPEKCFLNSARDMFLFQEGNKSGSARMDWKCSFCGKGFYAEVYIDKHMDNRHNDKLLSDGICLADLCEVLHCSEWQAISAGTPLRGKCQSQVMEKRYHHCQSLALTCFPLDGGPASARLNEFFMRQFCQAHTCDSRRKLFPEGRRVKSSSKWSTFKLISVFGLLMVFYGCFYACTRGSGKQAVVRRPSKKGSKGE